MLPYGGARPVKVAVKVGAMSGVDRDSLSFCFEAITKGTLFESLILAIEDAPADELELSLSGVGGAMSTTTTTCRWSAKS